MPELTWLQFALLVGVALAFGGIGYGVGLEQGIAWGRDITNKVRDNDAKTYRT